MDEHGARADLLVGSDGHGGYEFRLIDFSTSTNEDGGKTAADVVASSEDFLRTKYLRTIRRATGSTLSNGAYFATITNLTGLGRHLYENVVSPELKELVGRIEPGRHLHVVSDDFKVPLELVRNGGDFWGQMFVMSRAGRRTSVRLTTLRPSIARILNVVGAGMRPHVAEQATKLFDRFAASYDLDVVTIDGSASHGATMRVYESLLC